MSETEDLVLYDSFILMATFHGKLEINRLFDILKKIVGPAYSLFRVFFFHSAHVYSMYLQNNKRKGIL